MTTDTPKLDSALSAVTELIKATIDSNEAGRFAVAARMCQTAHALAMESATRADDFEQQPDPYGVYGDNVWMRQGGLYARAVPGRPVRNPIVHQLWGQGDIAREALGTAMPILEQYGAANLAQAEQAEAETLTALLAARAQVSPLQAVPIEKRIETLLAKINERNAKNAVVPTLVLRGHSAGEHGHGLPSDPGADDAAGAGCGAGAPEARPEHEPLRQAVGHGG